MRREYVGAAFASVLTAPLAASAGATTITANDLTNWPTGSPGPFYIVIDRGLPNEEKILCVSRSGNILTVYTTGGANGRAADGTSLAAHAINATIEHVFTATDADEANAHVNTTPLHITVCTSTTRPASPVANQTILETDTQLFYCYIDSEWKPVPSSIDTEGSVDAMLLMGG
jgi:hypothetical protein